MKHLPMILLLLFVVAVWGWTFVEVKWAIQAYGVLAFLAIRFLLAATVIAPFGLGQLRHTAVDVRRVVAVGCLIGFSLAMAFLLQTAALTATTATNTGVITGLFVVFAPLTNRVLFRVHIGWILWAAIGLGCVGLAMLAGLRLDRSFRGDLLALGGAFFFGLQIALLDRHAKHLPTVALAAVQLAMAAGIFLIASLAWQRPAWPTPYVWFVLIVTGIIATAVGFFVQTFVQSRLPAVQTATIIMLEPAFAALFGYLLAGDRLSSVQWLGAALMMAAFFIAEFQPRIADSLRARRLRRSQQAAAAFSCKDSPP